MPAHLLAFADWRRCARCAHVYEYRGWTTCPRCLILRQPIRAATPLQDPWVIAYLARCTKL